MRHRHSSADLNRSDVWQVSELERWRKTSGVNDCSGTRQNVSQKTINSCRILPFSFLSLSLFVVFSSGEGQTVSESAARDGETS